MYVKTILFRGGNLQECGDFSWRVSDCEELGGLLTGDDVTDLVMSVSL